ncbi:MAG: ribosomal protein S18-alanine N-acetyltransferase [Anaerolineae bacterium]
MDLTKLPYTILPMVLDDVPTVHTIEQLVFSLPWSASAFSYEIRNNPSAQYLVLRYKPWLYESPARRLLPRSMRHLLQSPTNEPSLLGYGGYWMVLEEAHICTLALRAEWRGRSLGELLLLALIDSALSRKAEVITLEVRTSNQRAQNLYLKYGFEITGRRVHYYSDNNEDAFIMSTGNALLPAYQDRLHQLSQSLHQRLNHVQKISAVPNPAELEI